MSRIVDLTQLEKQLKDFVNGLRRIGLNPTIHHNRDHRAITIVIRNDDFAKALQRKVPYTNVVFKDIPEGIVVVIKY